MAFALTRSFNVCCSKFLFTNFFKTQCNQKMLNLDYRTLSCRTDFVKIHRLFTEFRSLCLSRDLKKETKKVTITFLRHDGVKIKKVVPVGEAINDIFQDDFDSIPRFGSCSGSQECATCHIKLPKHIIDKLEEPSSEEWDTLVCANEYDAACSRLGCCIDVTEEMDGAVILVPEIVQDMRERED